MEKKVNNRAAFLMAGYLVIMLVGVTLLPLANVGFTTTDDMEIAINFGWGTSLMETAALKAELQGRIGFFWGYPLLRVPYLFEDRVWFSFVKIGSVVLLLSAIFYMVTSVTRSRRIAALALILFCAFVQNGWDHNALTSYPFAVNLVAALFLVSLGLFANAVDERKFLLTVVSGVLYFFSLTNESFVLYFPLFAVILMRGGRGAILKSLNQRDWLYILPLIISLFAYLCSYFVWRKMHASVYDGNVLNSFDLGAAAHVIAAYSFSAFPWASVEFVVRVLPDILAAKYLPSSIGQADFTIVAFIKSIAVGCLLMWFLMSFKPVAYSKRLLQTSVVLGIVSIFLPNLLLGFTEKHQNWVESGSYSYLYTYYSFISLVVLLAVCIVWLHAATIGWICWARYAIFFTISTSVSMVALAVEFRNSHILVDQILSQRKWEIVNLWIASEEFKLIPDGAVIVAPTLINHQRGIAQANSSYWSRYVSSRAGKKVQFSEQNCIILENCYHLIFRQEKNSDNQLLLFGLASEKNRYVSKDVYLYSLPSQVGEVVVGKYILDIKIPKIFLNNEAVDNLRDGLFAVNLPIKSILEVPRPTRINGNVDFELNQFLVSHYGVIPRLNPLQVKLGEGFYGWETNGLDSPWTWGKNSSNLVIVNEGEKNTPAKINFEATSLEEITLSVQGERQVDFIVKPGEFKAIEVLLELQAGENIIKISSDRSDVKPRNSSDQRELNFSIRKVVAHSRP